MTTDDTPPLTTVTAPPLTGDLSARARQLRARLEQLGPAALLDQLLTEAEAARVLVALTQPPTPRRIEALEALAMATEQLAHARAQLAADFPHPRGRDDDR